MICLPSAGIKQSGNLISIPVSTASGIISLRNPERAAVFYETEAAIYNVCGTDISDGNLNLKVILEKKYKLSPKINILIKNNYKYADLSPKEIEKISRYSGSIGKPPLILNIKQKQDIYVRFILTDNVNNSFIESYIDWKEWKIIENEFISIRDEINFCIKNCQDSELNEKKALLARVFERLWKTLGINFQFLIRDLDYVRLSVQWQGKSLFIPFEAISENILVEYCVPSNITKAPGKNNLFTIIYSDDAADSKKESFEISNILSERYSVEYFSDSNFNKYRTSLINSSYLHFTGHGLIEGKKGLVHIGGSNTGDLLYLKNADFAFLNCCSAGAYSEGIISSMINNGISSIIAAPYEIPAIADYPGFTSAVKLYNYFFPEDPGLFFDLCRIIYTGAGFYFRIFKRFNNKI